MPTNVIHDTTPSNQITSDHIRLHNHYEAVKITFTEDKVEFDVKENTTLFTKINWAREWYVKSTADIVIKLNNTDNDGIDVWSYETFLNWQVLI
jgi:hypothetical protein